MGQPAHGGVGCVRALGVAMVLCGLCGLWQVVGGALRGCGCVRAVVASAVAMVAVCCVAGGGGALGGCGVFEGFGWWCRCLVMQIT